MRLQNVRFDVFEGAIKRYGYVGRVRDDSLKEISNEINIDANKLAENDSYLSRTYKANKAFDHGNYDVEHLLVLGFLLCYHESDEKAANHLWGIINPQILSAVPKHRVLEVVDKILYYAVDVPYEIAQVDDTTDPIVKSYVEDLHQRKQAARDDLERRLPD